MSRETYLHIFIKAAELGGDEEEEGKHEAGVCLCAYINTSEVDGGRMTERK
jgi:hypothetical protein